MQILRCDSSHDSQWNEFVRTSPRASYYHRAEWRGINERCFGHRTCYLGAVEGDRIVGVFPIVRLKSLLFGNIACSLPFVNYGGPCGETDEIEQQLLDAAALVADEWRVDYLEIRSRRSVGARYPASEHKVSMTLDLEADPDVLWKNFKTTHRQEIRRGYKNGFTVKFGLDLLDDFYAVFVDSWRSLGTPVYSKDYFRRILEVFPAATRLCVVYAGSDPAAAAFDGLHNDTVEGMWLGTRGRYRSQLAGYVLYWELIKDACEKGFRRFHLGRSSAQSGAEVFKKKWNARATQLYWQYILRAGREVPQLNTENPRYRLAINAWRRLPISVTQALGPMIARSIP